MRATHGVRIAKSGKHPVRKVPNPERPKFRRTLKNTIFIYQDRDFSLNFWIVYDLFYIFSHCKQFAPVYEEIAKELEAKNPENPIRVAKIDATEPDLQPIAQVILNKHFQK